MLAGWQRATLFGLLVVASAACKDDGRTQQCMNTGGESSLVTNAASVRVAIFDGSVACPGDTGTPITDKTFGKGETITLDIKPGNRTIVLTAYDGEGRAIGRACTTTTLGKGDKICLDLVVEPLGPDDMPMPDAGDGGGDASVDQGTPDDGGPDQAMPEDMVPGPDLAPECTQHSDCKGAGQLCCGNVCIDSSIENCSDCGATCSNLNGTPSCESNKCVIECTGTFGDCDNFPDNGCETDTDSSAEHCGVCGRACSAAGTTARACFEGSCNPTCDVGQANCSTPASPAADNGCESSLNSKSSCGGCGNVCSTTNSTNQMCSGISCTYTCSANRQDCNVATPPNTDSCECEGTGCCTGACQVKHNTAIGVQPDTTPGWPWYDCVPLNTYDVTQATAACNAFKTAAASTNDCFARVTSPGNGTVSQICVVASGGCSCWAYATTGTDNTGRQGHALYGSQNGESGNSCRTPATSDPQWH